MHFDLFPFIYYQLAQLFAKKNTVLLSLDSEGLLFMVNLDYCPLL